MQLPPTVLSTHSLQNRLAAAANTRVAIAALICLLIPACLPEAKTTVYVPGPSYTESLTISSERGLRATVAPGQQLTLHASRRTGPWVAISRDSLDADACWLVSAPPPHEPEVADNVHWFVDPKGTATFNLGMRADRTRQVEFDAPGLYRVTAESGSRCFERFAADTLVVEVVAE